MATEPALLISLDLAGTFTYALDGGLTAVLASAGLDVHGEPHPLAYRVPDAACRRVRNVIDHRSRVTAGMWCCHCVRAGPDRT